MAETVGRCSAPRRKDSWAWVCLVNSSVSPCHLFLLLRAHFSLSLVNLLALSCSHHRCRFLHLLIAGELLTRLNVRVLGDALLVLFDERKDGEEHPAHVHLVAEEGVLLAGVA